MEEPPKGKLRTGFTTGTCASAAAKAATICLVTGKPQESVEVRLPAGARVRFTLAECRPDDGSATCGVIKDAGDDPDCTHGALLRATVSPLEEAGIRLEGGEGVGVVTKPGIGLEIGAPAINPVPRKMILIAVGEGLAEAPPGSRPKGVRVVISVPGGVEMAKKTLNERLGIIGGISILGTTGIVKPFSTAAYQASILQAIDVALASGADHIVVTTGGKSEQFARKILPRLREEVFIQMGDFVGFTIKMAAKKGVRRVTICGMIGKLAKIAAGKMQTHAAGSEVDLGFLADIAAEAGTSKEVTEQARAANTGRHFMEIIVEAGVPGVFDRICDRIVAQCAAYLKKEKAPAIEIEAILTDFEGQVLGRAATTRLPVDRQTGPAE